MQCLFLVFLSSEKQILKYSSFYSLATRSQANTSCSLHLIFLALLCRLGQRCNLVIINRQ